MSWDMSPGALRLQLHAIADATELNAAVLGGCQANIDFIALRLGELIRGGDKYSMAAEACSRLRTSVHNCLGHAIEDMHYGLDVARASANIL